MDEDEQLLCEKCGGVVSWRDCDLHEEGCFATECDGPSGCGRLDRDCEDQPFVSG